jgi:shikimate kinase
MAVGKSAVGRKLARRLKRHFIDLDREIERKTGLTVAEIFDQRGEDHFRSIEKAVLEEVLLNDGQVIATGGGAVLDPESLALLKERSLLIWLSADAEAVIERSKKNLDRPLLRGQDKTRRITELMRHREPIYGQAHIRIETADLSVDQVVEKIVGVAGNVFGKERIKPR